VSPSPVVPASCFAGPVVSIRLKNIREGMEDYECMQILPDLVERSAARR
jgi:hypothetical protein